MYTADPSEIKVFKTNIHTRIDELRVACFLDKEIRIRNWNIARDDIDKILRIVSPTITGQEVISLVNEAGYTCEELID